MHKDISYSSNDITLLFPHSDESFEVEYKSAAGEFPKSFWETFSAFANTDGGIIVLGVKEKQGKFFADGLTEEQATAYQKKFWKDNGWQQPTVKEVFQPDRVEITLFLDTKAEGTQESGGVTTQTTTQTTTQRILDAIKNEPSISRSKLATLCGISPDGVKWQLKKLQEQGILKRIGADFGGHWEIITS